MYVKSRELWNPLSKAVPDTFHGVAGIVHVTIYMTEPIFHRCLARYIVLIF